MNITDGIWRNCNAWPKRNAIIFDGGRLTYSALGKLAKLVAMRLVQAGVRRGDCVAIATVDPLAYLVSVLAIGRIGACSTPWRMRVPDATKEALLERHGVRWLIQDKPREWVSPQLPQDAYLETLRLFRPFEPSEVWQPPPMVADVDREPFYIALSSGTTGTPKSIAHTHGRYALSSSVGRQVTGPPQVVFVAADLSISMGLGNAIRTLLAGSTLVITRHSGPAEQLAVIAAHRPQRLVTTTGIAGALVREIVRQLPASREMCSSVQVMAVSGAAVPPALRNEMTTHVCPQIEVHYGSTEAGPMATATTETLAKHPDSAGRVHYWVEAQAVDEEGRVLPPGQPGLLRIKSATVVDGYVGDPETSAKVFQGGWFYPGDTGFVDEAGFLFLGARADHLINIGGQKLDPAQIETVLNAQPGVVESVVVAAPIAGSFSHVLVAAVTVSSPVDPEVLRARCREQLARSLVPHLVVFVDAFPRNAAGKVMRDELKRMIAVRVKSQGAVDAH